MKRWGISIYPEHSTAERDQAYLRMAAQHGCRRVFTCLLSVEAGSTQVKKQFAELTACAKDLGMEVIVDVAPVYSGHLGLRMKICPFSVRSEWTGCAWTSVLVGWKNR